MDSGLKSPDAELADLVSLWQRLDAEGREVAPEELCRDCPQLLPELVRRVAVLRRVNALAGSAQQTVGQAEASFSTLPPVDVDAGAQAPATPPSVPAPPVIPGHEILGELGRGGMGVVYKARDANLNRLVAVKMVLAGAHASVEGRGRFRAEAEAVARLQHPHVVQVYSWGEHEGLPYLVMEFVPGGSLDRRLAGRPQPPPDAARLVMLLARAVHAAHKAGIVHRDLKPANVLLGPPADEAALNSAYGWPKVADFGLARVSGGPGGLTDSFGVMGSASYMAPEQAEGKAREVGPPADVYALGAILYELLTGRPPFRGDSLFDTLRQVVGAEPEPPSRSRPGVPPGLEALCLRCLAKSPSARPATATELAGELQQFLESQSPAGDLPGPDATPASQETKLTFAATPRPYPARRGRLSRRAGWVAVAALLLACGVWLVVYLTKHPGPASNPAPPDRPVAAAPTGRPEGLRILRLDVEHYPTVRGHRDMTRVRLLGRKVFAARSDDSVKLEAKLSRPAYAFLIAFRPDGTEEVCFPEKDGEAPPRTDRPRYPSVSVGFNYGLEEGEGLQAFALVASGRPLPSYKEWRPGLGASPWGRHPAPAGVVFRADGVDDVLALTEDDPDGSTRGKGREVQGRTPVARLAAWLRRAPSVEQVEVLGFAVRPKQP